MRIRIHCGPMLGGLVLASSALAGCTTGNLGLPGTASAVPTARLRALRLKMEAEAAPPPAKPAKPAPKKRATKAKATAKA
jgi:hypothetical protein